MSEFFSIIRAIVEKCNFIVLLLAIAVSLFSYRYISADILLSAIVFCLSYVLLIGIYSLFKSLKTRNENKKKIEANKIQQQHLDEQAKKEKKQSEARLRTIYASLPYDVKEGLELLYRRPQPEGGFINSRILRIEQTDECQKILNACTQVMYSLNLEELIGVQQSINSQIITLLPAFYMIIEEKAKAKEE